MTQAPYTSIALTASGGLDGLNLRRATLALGLQNGFKFAGSTAASDGTVFRGVMETVHCLALPREVFRRPDIREKIETAEAHWPANAHTWAGP